MGNAVINKLGFLRLISRAIKCRLNSANLSQDIKNAEIVTSSRAVEIHKLENAKLEAKIRKTCIVKGNIGYQLVCLNLSK